MNDPEKEDRPCLCACIDEDQMSNMSEPLEALLNNKVRGLDKSIRTHQEKHYVQIWLPAGFTRTGVRDQARELRKVLQEFGFSPIITGLHPKLAAW